MCVFLLQMQEVFDPRTLKIDGEKNDNKNDFLFYFKTIYFSVVGNCVKLIGNDRS